MAKLIFKGHATRGKELHKLLEYLGGVDAGYDKCSCVSCFYYINREGYIEGSNRIPDYMNHRIIMSLETFESTYLYKVGDKVIEMNGLHGTITAMSWDECNCTVLYTFKDDEVGTNRHGYTATMLKPYKKEEAIKNKKDKVYITSIGFNSEECEICLSDDIRKDYELKFKDGKLLCVKKKPQYPKTYKECCKIVGFNVEEEPTIFGYKDELLTQFQHLLICRDTYWKIAEDWKYDVNKTEEYFYIVNKCGSVAKEYYMNFNYVLAFPTEEMRDAFYDNFKELIESCKELL